MRKSVNRKARHAAQLWPDKWGFYSQIREIQNEEALKLGMSVDQYRDAVRFRSCQPDRFECPVEVPPSTTPLPSTSSGMIGRRAQYPLECYGRLAMSPRDNPTYPPMKPSQIYDPYKQTIMFLGSVDGDPISYKLPPSRCEVTDEMWARPQPQDVSQLSWATLESLLPNNIEKQ